MTKEQLVKSLDILKLKSDCQQEEIHLLLDKVKELVSRLDAVERKIKERPEPLSPCYSTLIK